MTYQREGDDLVKSNGFEKEGDTYKVEVEFIAGVIKRAGENTPLPPTTLAVNQNILTNPPTPPRKEINNALLQNDKNFAEELYGH